MSEIVSAQDVDQAIGEIRAIIAERYTMERFQGFSMTNPDHFAQSVRDEVQRLIVDRHPVLIGWTNQARVELNHVPGGPHGSTRLFLDVKLIPPIARVSTAVHVADG